MASTKKVKIDLDEDDAPEGAEGGDDGLIEGIVLLQSELEKVSIRARQFRSAVISLLGAMRLTSAVSFAWRLLAPSWTGLHKLHSGKRLYVLV